MLYSRPGSLTVYTTAPRQGFPPPSDCPLNVAPNSYNPINHSIRTLPESIVPFGSTQVRKSSATNDVPSPASYNGNKPPQSKGVLGMHPEGDRFPPTRDETPGPGPAFGIGDPWKRKETEIYHQCNTMRPRVDFPKYVSNNVPSMSHPLDIRSFVRGGDDRMYPWRKPKRTNRQPGPIYDTYKIYTSPSNTSPIVDFARISERRNIFPLGKGPGPAEYSTGLPLDKHGGIFLSKSNDPGQSALRLLEIITRDGKKPHPGPADHFVPRDLDSPSPKGCSAPFKSLVPAQGFPKKPFGPGPQTYFRGDMMISDLEFPLWPYGYPPASPKSKYQPNPQPKIPRDHRVRLPEVSCGFVSGSERGKEPGNPPPNQYNLRGLAEDMWLTIWKHRPSVRNPKLGFLTCSEGRGKVVLDGLGRMADSPTIPHKWRNLKPTKSTTYPYHECPTECQTGDSPGPIYETSSGAQAVKGKRDWFNPRELTGTGFNNSGCGRKTMKSPDPDIPGPEYFIQSTIPGTGGRVYVPETGSKGSPAEGSPSPDLLHEKTGSMWRATQLGTFNTHLKGLGTLGPSAGGFHPHGPIDDLTDKESGYLRIDNPPQTHLNSRKS